MTTKEFVEQIGKELDGSRVDATQYAGLIDSGNIAADSGMSKSLLKNIGTRLRKLAKWMDKVVNLQGTPSDKGGTPKGK